MTTTTTATTTTTTTYDNAFSAFNGFNDFNAFNASNAFNTFDALDAFNAFDVFDAFDAFSAFGSVSPECHPLWPPRLSRAPGVARPRPPRALLPQHRFSRGSLGSSAVWSPPPSGHTRRPPCPSGRECKQAAP